ncbi:hypothetical protein [Thioalkalivibrio paradoxus]|uniref:DUF4168 domain-containing protein n=1 Tax=Thioalkalivibrio paradoxus ARh 1 TaxID=713585 RepID=W0DNB8_9GAMM|nr:hypothetical protein [Thioalkalivibrio paradoxus]AHF00090.1 hypothetical protein THITH_09140 [Thioalkalivibrio paradoxus ARh 1]
MAVLAVTVFALVFSGAALGQQQPGPLEREYVELQQRLAQAQHAAMENNPELLDQAEAMEELVTQKMRDAGYDPGGIMETLLAAQGRLQDEHLTDAQRREIVESPEVMEAQRELRAAQEAVAQDPEVVAAQQAYEDDLLEAMRREEPEVDRIIERLQQIQQEAQRGGR